MPGPLIYAELVFKPDAASQNSKAYVPAEIMSQTDEFTVYVEFSAGSAAGKIQIQTAFQLSPQMQLQGGPSPAPDIDSLVWANVGSTIDWAAASSQKYASVTGVFSAIRLNIDTAITTGTVRAFIVAKKY